MSLMEAWQTCSSRQACMEFDRRCLEWKTSTSFVIQSTCTEISEITTWWIISNEKILVIADRPSNQTLNTSPWFYIKFMHILITRKPGLLSVYLLQTGCILITDSRIRFVSFYCVSEYCVRNRDWTTPPVLSETLFSELSSLWVHINHSTTLYYLFPY